MPPNQLPPPRYDGQPRRFRLPRGTTLTRLHEGAYGVAEFNPNIARRPNEGGRFDSTPGDEHSFLYLASDEATALSEALLRDIPSDEYGTRSLLASRLDGMRIGRCATTRDLDLVSLRSGQDLGAIGQDTWLTASPTADYAMTRRWSAAIREWAPWAQGLTWRSRREPEGFAYVFFGDRCPPGSLEAAESLSLDGPASEASNERVRIERLLARYRVRLV